MAATLHVVRTNPSSILREGPIRLQLSRNLYRICRAARRRVASTRGQESGVRSQESGIMAAIKVEPGKTRVGWIGTGVMGHWMCQHLMTKGYAATVYNRTKDKAQ